MTRKILALTDYMTASEAAAYLSQKLARPILPKYIRKLARRKKKPVRTVLSGNRYLYLRADIEQVQIRLRGQALQQ